MSDIEPVPTDATCTFEWARYRLFDHAAATALLERCVRQPQATVVAVLGEQKLRHPPLPLNTLELQKKATQYLRLPGDQIMKLAEELYQRGFISYPRTETDRFSETFNPMDQIQAIQQDPQCVSCSLFILKILLH